MRQITATVALVAILAGGVPAPGRAQEAGDALSDAVAEANDATVGSEATNLTEADFLGEEALDTLVAPVALYPDALLAQVLVAATYPLQIVEADRLLKASQGLSDKELSDRLSKQDWDPSVLVLVSGFPTVVQRMADDLEWTEELGDAMVRQDDDVLAAVQRMRADAKETGYLATNAAQVVEEDQGQIAIRPADPDVVYVPTYDATRVYTSAPTAAPYIAPARSGFQPNPLVTGAIVFGAALLVQELFGNDDHNNKDDSWHDYWHRSRPIDWRDRQFYPRPYWQSDNDYRTTAWSNERDRYWDPRKQRWHRDGPDARRDYEAGRRDTLGWLVVQDPNGRTPQVRAFRRDNAWTARDEQARRQAERDAAARRDQRAENARRADKQQREAEKQREDRIAAQRRDARKSAEKAAAQQDKALKEAGKTDQRAAKAKADAQKAAAQDRAKAAADAKAKPITPSQAKVNAAFEQARARDAQNASKAQAAADAKSRAAAAAKASAASAAKARQAADANANAAAAAKLKAASDAQAKASADAKARASANAKAKAAADAKAKAAADANARAAAAAKLKAASDAQAKASADAKARASANAKAKAAADAKAKAASDARAKATANARAQKAAAQQQQQKQQQQQQQQQQKAKVPAPQQQQQQQQHQKKSGKKNCQGSNDKDCKS